ncbi:hypothetical protein POM88_022327 [Heracleum sosnowskyi]|uniref:Myb-like domain-containing protein n=1 Tax=Heracleum sosnowskyi TaxID=360622 RepID=A0AAD8IET6_9APIA|nr:hypothetical protein POM88_022327 [Heracleum sosnowskyi]
MSSSPKACSWRPWIWAVEFLASNHAETSILTDLVKKIPDDVLENDAKNVKELASLRILESLDVSRKGKCNGVGFAPSDCCENVLRQESLEPNYDLSESETLRSDVESFVENKRLCLPKCTLKQLKDVILKDGNLLPSSLKERSGLLINNLSDGVTKRPPEGSNCDAPENRKVEDLSSVKRVVEDSVTANQRVASACKQMIVFNAYPNFGAAMKRKRDAFCTQQVVEGNELASFNENRRVEDVPGGMVSDSGRDESNLDKEPQRKFFKGDISSKNVDYDFVASKKLKMSSTIEADLLRNNKQATRNVGKMTQGADEPKKVGEHCAELRTLGGSRKATTHKTKSCDEAKNKCEQSCSLISPNSLCCGGVKATMENDHQREFLSSVGTYHDENDDIFVRENTFSNAQYSDSQDTLAKLNGQKEELCTICKIGGQLLVCSSGSCQRVVHERCLGGVPTFDAKRRFYCPFCAYSRAAAEYSDCKKQLSLTRKALASFMDREKYRLRNSNVLGRENENHLRETDVSDKCIEQNNLQNSASRVNHARSMIHMKEKPSGSFDLISSREGERVVLVTGDENTVAKRNAERSGRSASCQSIREQVQQVPELDVHNGKVYNSFCGGSKELPVVEKLQEVLEQPNGVILVKNNEERKIASQAVRDSEVHNSNCKDLKITHGNEPLTETSREQDVSDQLLVLPCVPAKPLRCVEGTSGKQDDKSVACHSFRFQKQEQHYPYPSVPQLRRKKVPWSDAEEEALKEGVRRFANNHDKVMPWKKILEFGAEIFDNHRTAIDLKDKWRNICKGSPKV